MSPAQDQKEHQQRVVSSMLWAAWADAVGFISELTDESGLNRRLNGRPLIEPVGWVRRVGGKFGVEAPLPAGCYSDDTQLRLATARAISGHGFDVEAFARVELTVWPCYALGGGRASKAAAANLAKPNTPWFGNFFDGWHEAGGNGVAMRIQPHVWSAQRPATLGPHLLDVIVNGTTTHGHPRALVGAVLHAAALGVAIDSGVVPKLTDLPELLNMVDKAVELIDGHAQLGSLWRPSWEKATGRPFAEVWHATVEECRELLTSAQRATHSADSPEAMYERLVAALNLTDPARRGSGTATTIAALALAAALPSDPAAVSLLAARTLGTDTDTIATMAAALVGVSDNMAAPTPLLDAAYLRSEAIRLATIATNGVTQTFSYPDLLHWSPPRSQLEAVGVADNQVALGGLAWLKPVGELDPIEGKDGVWQWVSSDFGSSFLVKRRRQLRPLPEGNWPVRRNQVVDPARAGRRRSLDHDPAATLPGQDRRHRSTDPPRRGQAGVAWSGGAVERDRGDLAVPGIPAPRRRAAPNLVANFLPVRFIGRSFRAGTMPFETREQLASLRDELKGTHVAWRDGDRLICVPLVPDAREVGEQEEFAVGEHRSLTMRLVQEALVRELTAMKYKFREFAPPAFVSRYRVQDLLAECAGAWRETLAALHVYPEYRLDARVSGPSGQPGIIVHLKTRYEIDLTVADLLRHGVAVEGRYVLARTGKVPFSPDRHEYAYRRLVGAVDSVHGMRLRLRDARDLKEVDADQAWLECRRETFHEVIATLTDGQHMEILERLDEATFGLIGAEGRLARIMSLARRLSEGGPLTIADGVQVEVGQLIGSASPRRGSPRVTPTVFESPIFVFDPGGDKTSRSVEKGLTEFGPFDSHFFTPRRPRIMVLTPRAFQGAVEIFMDSFRRGVSDGKVYTQGFARKYRLTDSDVVIEAFDAGPRDATGYRNACLSSLKSLGKPHLAIVVTSEAQEDLQGDESPYLVAKSTLMGQGVPVQEVQIETIRKGNLAYPLDSMALACYAKLGGIPFVIAAPRTIAHELVIGIGSAHVKPSRFSDPERVVGITTVFSADGNYILSSTSQEADYEHYQEELRRALRVCIDDVKKRNAWQPDDALRLIFHIFKPLKDAEAEAVKTLVQGLLTEFRSVEFAFVHISDEHDWALFDTNSPGVANWSLPSGHMQPKGRYVPARVHAVEVSRTEILLTVSGPYDMKLPTQGLPRPLLLKLHRASTFTDIDYLAGQAFRFTAMSWRRPYPSSKPVTILYSDLIASLLGQLRHVRNWNADIISTDLRTSRWFL